MNWMETATQTAGVVYKDFLQNVVDEHVLKERVGSLPEPARNRIAKGTHIDARVLKLMAISGKGGWSDDPVKFERYARNTNVTLLDHLLSVVRGSLLLAALDYLGRNADMEISLLSRRLRVIATLAFLHDLDKMLALERNTRLPLSEIDTAVERYGLQKFLGDDNNLNAEQIRYLIEHVEASQTMLSVPKELPPRDVQKAMNYVALADKLDGLWLSSEPGKGGLKGVLKRLQNDQVLQTDLLRQWRALEIFDPHHPFLLDELQRWLSFYSARKVGVPPLIEVHQDGRLFLLLPENGFDDIVDNAIKKLCADLPFQLELNVSNRGVPALFNGQPDHAVLAEFIEQLPDRELGSLFRVKADQADKWTQPMDELLGDIGLQPRWPKTAGATTTPYPSASQLDISAQSVLRRAAQLTLLLNLKLDSAKKGEVPDYLQREQILLEAVAESRPEWLTTISDDASRRTLTALWVAARAADNSLIDEAVWGESGLLQNWLEGDGQNANAGFNQFITGRGSQVLAAVEQHFRQLLGAQRIVASDEQADGRCLFTDQPVPFNDTIDDALGLYGVRVSAFSGRDGRPELLTSERSHTNVGPVSVAEHKLRTRVQAQQGGKPEGVPTLVSSPGTIGLFGGLGMNSDASMGAMSLYDLSRQEIKKGTVYRGLEIYQGRYRMARFERMSEKTAGQINQLRMLLQACQRTGRPIHLFRGLPTPQRSFFHYDAMPRVLADLISGNSLRLEQIPNALQQLALAQVLIESNGLGFDVLRLYAAPSTRFGATCLAWCHLRDKDSNSRQTLATLQQFFVKQLEEHTVSEYDGALVKLGQAAAGIQKAVSATASGSEEMLVFALCMEAAQGARAAGQGDHQSLIFAIAGELETNLVRKGKAAARIHRDGKSLIDGCMEVAELFVDEVWNGVLKRRPPSQRNRRILGSIYRMAFLQAIQQRKAETRPDAAQAESGN